MVFISYAQNFEDVMLARALGTVETGFYIDVGAQDPDEDSVTRHFYDQGWRGLNFEPSEHYYARMEAARPRDTNLRCAVGDKPGTVTFYEAEGTGLSTIVEAVSEATSGARVPRSVPMTTLDEACAAHGVETVHFLKIDVEGAEELVLRGTRFERFRPWIVVVEATRPNSPEPYYAHWEPLLTERGYRFVYADGLNRFYLADEHAELAHHFDAPPNHFDRFVRASEVRADERAEKRAADNLAHHLGIIDDLAAERARQQAALEEHAARITAMGGQLEERQQAIAHHLGLIEEAAVRADAQQAEIGRLVGLLDEASIRERETIAHHLGLIEEAAARGEAQQTEITRLVGLLDEAAARADAQQGRVEAQQAEIGALRADIEALRAEVAGQRGHIAALEHLAERRARQIAFRDDKIGWLTLDRNRFRTAHTTIARSLIWRLTAPLQGAALRAATRAAPQVRLVLPDPVPAASAAPDTVPEAAPAAAPAAAELPDRARWLQQRLRAA